MKEVDGVSDDEKSSDGDSQEGGLSLDDEEEGVIHGDGDNAEANVGILSGNEMTSLVPPPLVL